MTCCADPSVHAPHGSCRGNQPIFGRVGTPDIRPTRSSSVKIEHSAKIEIKHDTTFGEIAAAVAETDIPDTAKVRIDHYAGDQRDPSYTNMIFRWET